MMNTRGLVLVMVLLASALSAPTGGAVLREGSLGTFSYAHRASVAVGPDGTIYLAASITMPEAENPLAKVCLWRSTDGGASWSAPQPLTDSPLDDVGAGVCVTADGTLLVNYSTSLGWALDAEFAYPQFEAWWDRIRGMSLIEASSHVNFWMIRSADSGSTWSAPVTLPANPLAGARELTDGTLFVFGQQVTSSLRQLIDGERNNFLICAAISKDQGRNWEVTKSFPAVSGVGRIATSVHQTGFAENASGEIVVFTQNSFEGDGTDLNQFEILGGYGAKWSKTRKIVQASAFHALARKNGDLLLTYTPPAPSVGLFVKSSADGGKTWADAQPVITSAGEIQPGFATAELATGALVTVWFERNSDQTVQLRYCVWRP